MLGQAPLNRLNRPELITRDRDMLDKMGKCRVARVSEKENGAPSASGLSSESKKVKMIRRQIEMAREQRVGARVDNICGQKKKRGK